jgi:sulfhydrogenase subunit gamma (sulfur reductase)
MDNLYMPQIATVLENHRENDNIHTLTLALDSGEHLESIPGQFIELTLFGVGEFPVSISGVLPHQKKKFQATIQKMGKVTHHIETLEVGAKVGIRGPFGNGFPMSEMEGKDICLIAGGIGLAPLKYLLDCLKNDNQKYGKITLLYGAKNPGLYIYCDTYIFKNPLKSKNNLEILITVDEGDKGWTGPVGVVTTLIEKVRINAENTVAVVCGPSVMMKFSCFGLSELGLGDNQIYLSMERKMQCGMGVCGHCMLGGLRVCVNGPVFTLRQIKDVLEQAL